MRLPRWCSDREQLGFWGWREFLSTTQFSIPNFEVGFMRGVCTSRTGLLTIGVVGRPLWSCGDRICREYRRTKAGRDG